MKYQICMWARAPTVADSVWVSALRVPFHLGVWWRWERCQWLTNDERVCSTRRRTNICALFFSFFSFVCSIYYARKTGSLFVARHRRRCRFHLFCLGSMCCHCVRPFCTFLLFFFSLFLCCWLAHFIIDCILFLLFILSTELSSDFLPLSALLRITYIARRRKKKPSLFISVAVIVVVIFFSFSLVVAVCRSINTNSKSDQYNTKLQRCVIHAKDNLKRQTQMRCEAGAARVYTRISPSSLSLAYIHTHSANPYKIIIISIKMNKGQ